jgi:hypothetical protein
VFLVPESFPCTFGYLLSMVPQIFCVIPTLVRIVPHIFHEAHDFFLQMESLSCIDATHDAWVIVVSKCTRQGLHGLPENG